MNGNPGGNVKPKAPARTRRTGDRAETLKHHLDGREVSLLRWLGIAWPPPRKGKHINCPFPGHDDKNPSWRWDQRKKAWFCSKCGGGDVLRAVQEMRGVGFLEACDIVERDFLGQTAAGSVTKTAAARHGKSAPASPQPAGGGAVAGQEDDEACASFLELAAKAQREAADERKEEELRRQRAERFWETAVPVSSTLAETYFETHRGILADWHALSGAVRFHAQLWCSERQGYHPAILFRVSAAPGGELMTVHRLYLDPGGGKAKIANPKKAYSDFAGGAIWFGAPAAGAGFVLAEGPENALVCFVAGHPFAAAGIGGANMKNVRAPEGVSRILIAGDRGRGADGKKAGEDFAEDAALAARKGKLGVRLTFPPARPKPNGKWEDWNDLLQSEGIGAVREALAQSEPWEDLPAGYRWQESGKGIEFLARIVKNEAGEEEEEWEWLCSQVKFLATTLNAESQDWGLYLQIRTRNNVWHTAAVPKTELVTASEDIFKRLAFLGLDFNIRPRAKLNLRDLLALVKPRSYALCVPKVGFHDGVFVLPRETIGDTKGRTVVFQPQAPIDHAYKRRGTLKGWQDGIAARAAGNGRLMFAISTAFAPPLLEPLGMEGGGIHLRGGSTAGKTTALRAAGTVWGGGGQYGFIRTWRATDNALEAVAAIHNNAFLPLDEIAEIDSKALFKAAYALANGRQKERMQKTADLRTANTWRLLFMSTGEIGLAEKLSEDRMKVTGGQSVRLIELSAEAGCGMGMFETLHSFAGPKELAQALDAAGREHYGHAAPAFIRYLTQDMERLTGGARDFVAKFTGQVCPQHADGQVVRVAQRFGLIAAAGEMAIAAGIVPWKRGEPSRACKQLFAEWIAARGTSGPIEIENALLQIKRIIERDGPARFTPWHLPSHLTISRLGFVRVLNEGTNEEEQLFYVLPEAWKELCQGFDPKLIAKALVERSIIQPDNDGKFQKPVRLPGMGVRRCYEIHSSTLFPDDSAVTPERIDGVSHGKSVLNGGGDAIVLV